MQNIEVKAFYPDLNRGRALAREKRAKYLGKDRQVDTYYRVAQGRLKLRESSLSGAQLVPYIRPNRTGPKRSDYTVVAVDKPAELKRLLSALLGVDVVVDKVREIFLLGNVRLHLDRVKGLGTFLEFEAVYSQRRYEKREYAKVRALLEEFGIGRGDLAKGSYRELVISRRGLRRRRA